MPDRLDKLLICGFALVFWQSTGTASAQEAYKKGESIEVLHLGEWRPATVIQSKKKQVQAQFFFGTGNLVRVFKEHEVRREYESGAMWRGRVWSDASKKFKVKAALLQIEPDSVTLRTEDSREIKIEVAKLCDADQKFILKLRTNMGGGAALSPLPEIVEFDSERGNSLFGSKGQIQPLAMRQVKERTNRTVSRSSFTLEADPLKPSMKLVQAGVPIPQGDFFDYVSDVIPVGGSDGWLLASIQNSMDQFPTRICWASLAKKKVKVMHAMPTNVAVLDYHAPSRQLLTYLVKSIGESPLDHNSALVIWKTDPSATEAKAVVGWRSKIEAPMKRAGGLGRVWGRFASNSIVLNRAEDHQIVAWDIEQKKAIWSVHQDSFFAAEPVLSHNGKYLFVPGDTQLNIIDPASGQSLGEVKTERSCTAVALHDNGKSLAILADRQLLVVDITKDEPVQVLSVPVISSHFDGKIMWINDDLIAIENFFDDLIVFSLSHQLPVWTYSPDHDVRMAKMRSNRTQSIVANHLAYFTSLPGIKNGFAVGAVGFPEAGVVKLAQSLDRKDFMLMGPGTRVSKKVSAIESAERIQEALTKQIADNGWIEDASAEYQIVAELKRGKQETVEYETMGVRQSKFSVSITPYVSSYQIYQGQEMLWVSESTNGLPPILRASDQKDAQSAAKEYEVADIGFFDHVDIPDEIIDPKLKGGLGTSNITLHGLVPQ